MIRNKGQMIASRVLKYADQCWKSGKLKEAIDIYNELLPFILPKLQSVDMNVDSNLTIDVTALRSQYQAIIESRNEFLQAGTILIECDPLTGGEGEGGEEKGSGSAQTKETSGVS
ncbi:MAG: hypothetical protein IMZ61_06370 [Planctomycetes bacterium]|nr:hypothetical protein [Planctomycetota bacterium]